MTRRSRTTTSLTLFGRKRSQGRRVNDYKLYVKSKLEARALILHAVEKTWVLELKDEEILFTQVTPRQLLDHLQSICGGLHAIDVLALQNEMQEYHTDSKGILEYINALKAAQKKSKSATGNSQLRTRPSSS